MTSDPVEDSPTSGERDDPLYEVLADPPAPSDELGDDVDLSGIFDEASTTQ